MWYAILLLSAPEFFYLRAAGGCLARTPQSKPGCCGQTQCQGGAMQNGTRKAYFNFSLAAFDTTTTRLFVVDRPDRPLGEPRAKLLSAGHHLQHGTCRSAQPHTIWFIHIQTITSTMIRAYRSMPHSSVRAALRYLQHGACRST